MKNHRIYQIPVVWWALFIQFMFLIASTHHKPNVELFKATMEMTNFPINRFFGENSKNIVIWIISFTINILVYLFF